MNSITKNLYFCGVKNPITIAILSTVLYLLAPIVFAFFIGIIYGIFGIDFEKNKAILVIIAICLSISILLIYISKKLRFELFTNLIVKNIKRDILTGFKYSLIFIVFLALSLLSKDSILKSYDTYDDYIIRSFGVINYYTIVFFTFYVVIASVVEEIIYRQLLLKRLYQKTTRAFGNLIVTIIFILMHLPSHGLIPAKIFGWFLVSIISCLAFGKTRSWIACSIVHLIYNFKFLIIPLLKYGFEISL